MFTLARPNFPSKYWDNMDNNNNNKKKVYLYEQNRLSQEPLKYFYDI